MLTYLWKSRNATRTCGMLVSWCRTTCKYCCNSACRFFINASDWLPNIFLGGSKFLSSLCWLESYKMNDINNTSYYDNISLVHHYFGIRQWIFSVCMMLYFRNFEHRVIIFKKKNLVSLVSFTEEIQCINNVIYLRIQ